MMSNAIRLSASLVAVILLTGSRPSSAAEWYVAPQGKATGKGTKEAPWDLRTALNHPAAVQPGDTIWLRGGTYPGHFNGNLKGTEKAPILVRQYPGERAVLDGNFNVRTARMGSNVLTVAGAYTWYWGFEITSSYPNRKYKVADYGVVELPAGLDVGNSGKVPGIRLINLVIHDTMGGPGVWRGATDQEMYGCLVFNTGYDAPDRGHGHGTYTQSETTTRRIVDNIIFDQYSYGIHAYGSAKAPLNNFHIEGNILFDNGGASTVTGYTSNILVGGGRTAERPVIRDNYSYYPTGQKGGIACTLKYGRGSLDPVVQDNYFVSGGRAFTLKAEGARVTGNVFIGATEGCDAKTFPDNTYLTTPPREGARVFVRPNRYEPGRAHVCVFNWDNADRVPVDVSRVLKRGDSYEVRDVQNLLGPAVAQGTYEGKPVELPMDLTAVTQPTGTEVKQIKHTPREFNAFVLTTVRRNAGSAPPPPKP
jgi:hypothetical protein